jgi:DNA polymerase-3 subunit alpha
MEQLAGIYPDRLYVELQRHPGEGGAPEIERLTERGHVEMAYEMGLPLVATNDVYFPKPGLYEAHDAMICIAEGAYVDQSEPRRRLTPQHSFKSPEEMAALFADLPEALENTVEIARAVPIARGPMIRSCRNSPRTRWRSCAANRGRGSRRALR